MKPDTTADFIAVVAPVCDPVALFQSAAGKLNTVPPGPVSQLSATADALPLAGDPATASFIRKQMAVNGLG
jgi:hypothetical protein